MMKFLEICISLFKFRRVLIKSIFFFHWKKIIESIIKEQQGIFRLSISPPPFLVNRVVTSAPSSDVLTNSPLNQKPVGTAKRKIGLIDFSQLSCTGTPLAVSINRIIISISWKDGQLCSASL